MTRGTGRRNSREPFGFEQSVIGQTHQQRVERAGLQLRFVKQIISVPPYVRSSEKRFQNGTSLQG